MSNKCPKCDSLNTYVDKKGFSGKKAVVGAVLIGPLGAAAGTLGSNKIQITCLDCGYSYFAGEYAKSKGRQEPIALSNVEGAIIFFIMAFLFFIISLIFGSQLFGILSGGFLLFGIIIAMVHYLHDNNNASKQGRSRAESEYERLFSEAEEALKSVNTSEQLKEDVVGSETHLADKNRSTLIIRQKVVCVCGSINELHYKFCRVCGTRIDISKMQLVKNGQAFEKSPCPACQKPTPRASKKCKFCTNCGHGFDQ